MTLGVCAVVLAAGRGARMRGGGIETPKHLIEVGVCGDDGSRVVTAPMIAHVVRALAGSRATRTIVVLKPGDAMGADLTRAAGALVRFADPPDEGRAASVRAGVNAAPDATGWLFALADQPLLRTADFDLLITALGDASTPSAPGWHRIVHASYGGERGSPVLFGPGHRDALLALRGKQGGRAILGAHPEQAVAVEIDPAHGRDLDAPEDLPKSG